MRTWSRDGWTVRRLQAATALLLCLSSFLLWGGFILLVAGLLYRAQRGLSLGRRWQLCTVWGVGFALVFYGWAYAYGWLAWFALVAVRALPWGVFGLFSHLLEKRESSSALQHAVACGAGYALVTYLLLLGITGADWETPLAALTPWPWLLSFLPWTGLVGGSFCLGLLSWLLCSAERKTIAAGLGAVLLFVAASTLLYSRTESREVDLQIALLQTGWSQDVKWDRDNVGAGQSRLLEMTTEAAEKGARLVIWPETAWPVRGMRRRFTDTRKIGRLARKLKVEVLASSIEEGPNGWYNSVSQVLPSGAFEAEYRKRRLAPFAEYIPLPREHQFTLREMKPFQSISPYLPGEELVVFQSDQLSYGVLICYESMTPWPARELAQQVDFLVVVTNDAPFLADWPKEAHFRSAVLRAIENRRPVYQAANTGVTGFINSKGSIITRTQRGFSDPVVKWAGPNGN